MPIAVLIAPSTSDGLKWYKRVTGRTPVRVHIIGPHSHVIVPYHSLNSAHIPDCAHVSYDGSNSAHIFLEAENSLKIVQQCLEERQIVKNAAESAR